VSQLLAFLGVAVLVIVTPGPDTAVTIRGTLLGGRRAGMLTACGVVSGQACWTVAASAGLTAVLVASEPAFLVVKLAGAAYLVWLGIQTIRDAREPAPNLDLEDSRIAPRRAYLQGLLSTVLNPKPALFFLTFVPQFVDRDHAVLPQTLTFAAIHVLVGLVWLTVYAHLVDRARAALTAPRVKAWLERGTGAVLIALGLRVAVERR
jgi:threonine/homoserine/homoserine lactone efflux protein